MIHLIYVKDFTYSTNLYFMVIVLNVHFKIFPGHCATIGFLAVMISVTKEVA